MNRIYLIMTGSIVALAGLFYVLSRPTNRTAEFGDEPLMMFCAASNRAVIESIAADYKDEFDRTIDINFGPSQGLLSQIEVSKAGELYLPADDSYLERAKEKGLISEILPIGRQQAVIAVAKGNPKNINSYEDLLREDIRVVQANPDGAAVGKLARKLLKEVGKWDALDKHTVSYRGTVTEVANDIKLGAADAGLVYDALLHTYPELEYVQIPEFEKGVSPISVGVIAATSSPQKALHFARYISAKDRGQKRYREFGFQVTDGDEWSDVPELNIFAGSMLRPAIDDTISRFEKREGVSINRKYNGCGLLVADMKAGQQPDAYFACDMEFMDQVADLFTEPVSVSENQLVILVQKGNPKNIRSMKDLTREGIRVGIGHEKQCAMGWITQNTFRDGGIQSEVMENVAVQSATGDLLVNKMRARSLDAAVVYLSNAAGSAEQLDAIAISGIECSTATQPWAVASESKYPNLASRLFQKIAGAESQEIFEAEGFSWQLEVDTQD